MKQNEPLEDLSRRMIIKKQFVSRINHQDSIQTILSWFLAAWVRRLTLGLLCWLVMKDHKIKCTSP